MTAFYKEFCYQCGRVHWVEITPARRVICHGETYFPKETATHYTRWRNGGIELCEQVSARRVDPAWQMAQEANERAEFLLQLANQEW
jgi:hypothetical protein